MSRRRKKVQRAPIQRATVAAAGPPQVTGGRAVIIVLAVGLLLGLVGLGWWLAGNRQAVGQQTGSGPQVGGSLGGVTGCRGLPRFAERLGYRDRLAISTSEPLYSGLVIFDGRVPLSADASRRDIHQEPSWDDAGTLGPFVLDRAGHIYVAPVPRTAVSDNPPGSLHTIYRIDSETAVLQPFVSLPGPPAGSTENPFGILGMTYDCDGHALYVSTVGGSTRQAEQGRIVRIDLASKAISDEVVGVDAIGLAIFQGPAEKRLYMGMARNAELVSVALDQEGHAAGELRSDLVLDEGLASFAEPRVRRISFEQANMTLYVVPFTFNLRAVSEQQQVTLRYGYDALSDGWVAFPDQ